MDSAAHAQRQEARFFADHPMVFADAAYRFPDLYGRFLGSVLAIRGGLFPTPEYSFVARFFFDLQADDQRITVREPVFKLAPDSGFPCLINGPQIIKPVQILPFFLNDRLTVLVFDEPNHHLIWFCSSAPNFKILEFFFQTCPAEAGLYDELVFADVPRAEFAEQDIPTVLECLVKSATRQDLPTRPVWVTLETLMEYDFQELHSLFTTHREMDLEIFFPQAPGAFLALPDGGYNSAEEALTESDSEPDTENEE